MPRNTPDDSPLPPPPPRRFDPTPAESVWAPARPSGWPAAPEPGHGYAPGYGAAPSKPPRPAITRAGATMIAGAVITVVGTMLTWLTLPESWAVAGIPREWNGFTEVVGENNDGPVFVVLAVIAAGFGIASLAAKRLLPVLILAVVLSGFGLLAAVVDIADVSDVALGADTPSLGPGLPVVAAGFAVTIAGAVAGLARRRR